MWCVGFSCCGAGALGHVVFSSRGSRALEHGPVFVAHGLSCSLACGIFPDQGSNPRLLHWQADSLPQSHQGSSRGLCLICPSARLFYPPTSACPSQLPTSPSTICLICIYASTHPVHPLMHLSAYSAVCLSVHPPTCHLDNTLSSSSFPAIPDLDSALGDSA